MQTVDDPLEHAHVLAEPGPEEVAVVVTAEPVDAEDARRAGDVPSHVQPVGEVVAHVVAAERQHRHGVAPRWKLRIMARTVAPKMGAADGVVSLKVTLKGTKPPIWRRLLVPGSTRLGDLSEAILTAMGWVGGHLHAFDIDGRQYGDPAEVDDVANENRLTLSGVCKSGVKRFGCGAPLFVNLAGDEMANSWQPGSQSGMLLPPTNSDVPRRDLEWPLDVCAVSRLNGAVTLPREEHERSTPYGFLSRRDGLTPRGHRRGA